MGEGRVCSFLVEGLAGFCVLLVVFFFFKKERIFVSPYNSSLVHSSLLAREDFIWIGL